MRLHRPVVFLALAMLSATAAGPAVAADPAISAKENAVRLDIGATWTSYQESISPQDRESGAMAGAGASVSVLRPFLGVPDVYAGLSYSFSGGSLNYRGAAFNLTNGTISPYETSDRAYFNRVEGELGIGLPMRTAFGPVEVIPYIAGGYQDWFRNIGGSAGYGEFYQARLAGGGVKVDLAATNALVLSAQGEVLGVLGGSVQVPGLPALTPRGLADVPFHGSFGPSAEERISLDADYRMAGPWHAFADVGVNHFNYAGSQPDATTGFHEPISSTVQVSSMLGIAYGF